MISFDGFIPDGILPIYLQIILFIKRGLIAGSVVNGDELPSRRVLSALLGVNPNTVQKAFALLEEQGLISSRAGAKSVISVTDDQIAEIKAELLLSDIKSITSALKQMGLSREEAARLIEENWE
ncbi:MAG: GntR family transcriptional regulator [Clostridia bacterium]|nr:GntR family transcriptional regulator [Clostridia bacterium]